MNPEPVTPFNKPDVKHTVEPSKAKAEPPFVGDIICIDETCITLSCANGAHHTRTVTPDTKVTLAGKSAALADLRPGCCVEVVGDPVTSIKKE